jgi:hypothetical protein
MINAKTVKTPKSEAERSTPKTTPDKRMTKDSVANFNFEQAAEQFQRL